MTPREFYAEEIEATCGLTTPALARAFATVPREEFVGPGPWMVQGGGDLFAPARRTADADPRRVYHNLSIAIDPERQLYNGAPGVVATWLDALALAPGAQVLHVGCGTGYYSAIIAEVVGPGGSVMAVGCGRGPGGPRARRATGLADRIGDLRGRQPTRRAPRRHRSARGDHASAGVVARRASARRRYRDAADGVAARNVPRQGRDRNRPTRRRGVRGARPPDDHDLHSPWHPRPGASSRRSDRRCTASTSWGCAVFDETHTRRSRLAGCTGQTSACLDHERAVADRNDKVREHPYFSNRIVHVARV